LHLLTACDFIAASICALKASVLALVGALIPMVRDQKVETIDPNSILFSVPTISDDLAPLEPVEGEPSQSEFAFHEDDWSQVEFIPKGQLATVHRMLEAYKPFEAANRVNFSWRKLYVCKINRAAVVPGREAVARLEAILGLKAGPAPVLFSSSSITGRVKGGFSLRLGGSVTLYGYAIPPGIPVLAALLGDNPVPMGR
jgi:hypothetical protein